MNHKKPVCLVTGANGLIGSTLLPLLKEYEIFAIVRRPPIMSDPQIQYLTIDLSQTHGFENLPEHADIIIHLAQSQNFRAFPDMVEEIFNTNTVSTLRLLDYAKKSGTKQFILASSGGIYGFGEKEFSEEMETKPQGEIGFYLGTKYCSEVVANNYTSFMDVIMLRFFFVYGAAQKSSMLIPRLINSVNQGIPIVLNGGNGIRINPIYVSDAAMAIYKSLTLKGSHKINVAGSEILSIYEIAGTIGKYVQKHPVFDRKPAESNNKNLIGDISKMKKLLLNPTVSFEGGIAQMVEELKLPCK